MSAMSVSVWILSIVYLSPSLLSRFSCLPFLFSHFLVLFWSRVCQVTLLPVCLHRCFPLLSQYISISLLFSANSLNLIFLVLASIAATQSSFDLVVTLNGPCYLLFLNPVCCCLTSLDYSFLPCVLDCLAASLPVYRPSACFYDFEIKAFFFPLSRVLQLCPPHATVLTVVLLGRRTLVACW